MSSLNSRMGRTAQQLAVPLGTLMVMSVVATLGFRSVVDSWSFLSASIVGALVAAASVVVTRAIRVTVPEALLVALIGFFAFGAVAVGGVPTPSSLAAFIDGLVTGWASVLSATPPADLTTELRALPYTVVWIGVVVGGEILRSGRTPGLAALGPLAALAVAVLVTLETRQVALVQGGVMIAGTLVLVLVQQQRRTRERDLDEAMDVSASRRPAALFPGVAVVVLLAVLAPALGPRLPLAQANERFDLREFQRPPFDPLRAPSPLVQVKAAYQEANAETVVFTVASSARPDRFPMAVMDRYTGEFWAVADETPDAPARFRPVDSTFPAPLDVPLDEHTLVSATFVIRGLDQLAEGEMVPIWLPTAGWPVSIRTDDELDLRFSAETGTVAVPTALRQGQTYQLVSAVPPNITTVRRGDAMVSVGLPVDLAVPQLRSFAADTLEGADRGLSQVEQIRARLVEGRYDRRDDSQTALPGHSLARLTEFIEDPERLVGFEEQYAALAALIGRSEGLPVRVVVGYRIIEPAGRWNGDTLEVLADDLSAWIELRIDGVGWIPFDVTPDRERDPDETQMGRSQRTVAVPNPPPPPPPPIRFDPPELFEDEEDEEEEAVDEDEETDEDEPSVLANLPVATIAVVGAATSPVWMLGLGALAVLVLKRRRTRRRRSMPDPAVRVAGAWYETVDRLDELGARPRPTMTPSEYARGVTVAGFLADDDAERMAALAQHVEVAAFHPDPDAESLASDAWGRSDEVRAGISRSQGVLRRLRVRVDPRPLLRHDPVARAAPPEETISERR